MPSMQIVKEMVYLAYTYTQAGLEIWSEEMMPSRRELLTYLLPLAFAVWFLIEFRSIKPGMAPPPPWAGSSTIDH